MSDKVSSDERSNHMMRTNDVALILSWNTIRCSDESIMKFIANSDNIDLVSDQLTRYLIIERFNKHIDLGGLTEDDYITLVRATWYDEYKNNKETCMYPLLNLQKTAKFKDVIVAHNTFGVDIDKYDNIDLEDEYKNIYFDGSIESIEAMIEKYKPTMIVFDDIDYMYELVGRDKIKLEGLSFIISMINYNYEMIDSKKVQKYYDYFLYKTLEKNFEYAMGDLFKFDFRELDVDITKLLDNLNKNKTEES